MKWKTSQLGSLLTPESQRLLKIQDDERRLDPNDYHATKGRFSFYIQQGIDWMYYTSVINDKNDGAIEDEDCFESLEEAKNWCEEWA